MTKESYSIFFVAPLIFVVLFLLFIANIFFFNHERGGGVLLRNTSSSQLKKPSFLNFSFNSSLVTEVAPSSTTCGMNFYQKWKSSINISSNLSCSEVQSKLVPKSETPFSECTDPNFDVNHKKNYEDLLAKLLETPCYYAGSQMARSHLLSTPSPNSSVYLVFAMAHHPTESVEMRNVRLELASWSLRQFRSQFGSSIEITVVELFETETTLDIDSRFGNGTVNFAILGTNAAGQDWGMYQEGINAVWHRREQFDWIIVMNDVMVGPTTSFPEILRQVDNTDADIFVTSNWGGCCIRGFFVGFPRRTIATDTWQRYWQRVAFPCNKIGPMYLGEGVLTRYPVGWTRCQCSTNHPLSSNDDLGTQIGTNSGFLYRKGLVAAFKNDEQINTTALFDFIQTRQIRPHVEPCRF